MKTVKYYEVMNGPFTGYCGQLVSVAGIAHLKSISNVDDWSYILVTTNQLEFIGMAEIK